MVFSSIIFIFYFLPITLILYFMAYKTKKINIANIVLLISSMLFYAWGGVKSFIILLFVIIVNYILTIAMCKCKKYKKIIFILIIILDVGNLLYFKYFNFCISNINLIANLIWKKQLNNISNVLLPIGISFYTFQIISYVVDVYKGKVELQKDLIKFSLYVLMFPQLVAGPIVRYSDINNEINKRSITSKDIEEGIKRFIIGFAKKIFIANEMGKMVDIIFEFTGGINTLYAWLGAICYTFQIYYDFSAYSDMAIGLGRIFGFHFNENFNYPYISKSIQEFWRRWHISLSEWFRDYIYIPLGGNRKGNKRTIINLGIIFLLTGLWHGAAWQFIVWGIYNGIFIIIERTGFKKILDKTPNIFRHLYTMIIVIIGWVFFRSDNIASAFWYIKNMFSLNFDNLKSVNVITNINNIFIICFLTASIFSFKKINNSDKRNLWNNKEFVRIRYILLFIISILYISGISYNPFIYFKF